MRKIVAGLLLVLLAACAGAPTGGGAAAPTAAATVTGAAAGATAAGPSTEMPDPVAFFRGMEPVCRAHAERVGNSPIDPAWFAGTVLVADLGNGGYLVQDGAGNRLVVRPAAGTVLPESGSEADVLPAAYSFGCPEDVFLGSLPS